MLGVGGQGEQEYNNTRATNANAYEAEYMLREDSRSMKGARSRLDERAEFLDKEATEKKMGRTATFVKDRWNAAHSEKDAGTT